MPVDVIETKQQSPNLEFPIKENRDIEMEQQDATIEEEAAESVKVSIINEQSNTLVKQPIITFTNPKEKEQSMQLSLNNEKEKPSACAQELFNSEIQQQHMLESLDNGMLIEDSFSYHMSINKPKHDNRITSLAQPPNTDTFGEFEENSLMMNSQMVLETPEKEEPNSIRLLKEKELEIVDIQRQRKMETIKKLLSIKKSILLNRIYQQKDSLEQREQAQILIMITIDQRKLTEEKET
ncbi:hypothetical protein FGO68_gene14744 [Halteria grandinella]|uniref:Uncharacterized protein n=1 Tax=Halteria grandinella TaxID=5974 RepID=A0A8J8T526_HALGN|nr:hypothetical protein FGO68_gene14744 [Halteria grandinella]